MANKIIYGCVDWATGQIKFAGEACDSGDYIGCVEWTGIHAGQVAITLSEVNCTDTYYGCVDWVTGKFQVSIPDDCCAQSCTYCEQTPYTITATFSGITTCTGCVNITCSSGFSASFKYPAGLAENLNGSHVLTQVASYPCNWEKIYTNQNYGSSFLWVGNDCISSPSTPYTYDTLQINVSRCSSSEVYIVAAFTTTQDLSGCGVNGSAFEYSYYYGCDIATITNCITVSNLPNDIVCSQPYICGAGGVVSI